MWAQLFTKAKMRGGQGLTVAGAVDGSGQLADLDFEALLDVFKDFLVFVAAYEGNGESLCAEPARTAHSVKVGVRVIGHVVVEHDVDLLNVDTARENVRRDQEAELELFEALIDFDPNQD